MLQEIHAQLFYAPHDFVHICPSQYEMALLPKCYMDLILNLNLNGKAEIVHIIQGENEK